MQYRREIDGLRALAVLPVMLFHAGFMLLPGGYLGVDIFFVVSGYLITALILDAEAKGCFTFTAFYLRRARRILPALFVVCAVCLPFACYWLLPDDLENFGQSLFATQIFSNNLLLWLTSGYFDIENDFKPLMHTWSLGVEEQFYLLFPLLLLATRSLPARWRRWSLCLIALLSLLAAFAYFDIDYYAVFFFFPLRAWELLAGALLAFTPDHDASGNNPSRAVSTGAALLGLGLIGGAMLYPWQSTGFWRLESVLPVLGTVLLIRHAKAGTFIGTLLGQPLLVGIGLISYSAYLWHQPLLAAVRLTSLTPPSAGLRAAVLVLSLAIAWLSWRYVETPFRHPQRISNRRIMQFAVAGSATLALGGLLLHLSAGLPGRWQELSSALLTSGMQSNAAYNLEPDKFRLAAFPASAQTKVLVAGNSFARDFINAAQENGYFSRSSVIFHFDIPSCFPSVAAVEQSFATLVAAADYVILTASRMDLSCLEADLAILDTLGDARLIIVGTKNFGWNYTAALHLPLAQRYDYRIEVRADDWEYNEELKRRVGPARFVDLLGLLADNARRVPIFTADRQLISQDRRHLTPAGARFLGQLLFAQPLLRPLQ